MSSYLLLYDKGLESVVNSKIVPLFSDHVIKLVGYEEGKFPEFNPNDVVITYLSDPHLRRLFIWFEKEDLAFGILPHPQQQHARAGYGISLKIEEAVADIISAKESKKLDLMLCNGLAVLNAVKLGELFTLAGVNQLHESSLAKISRFISFSSSLSKIKLLPFKITTKKEKKLETAALGIVLVEHGRSNILTRSVLEDSAANDGMMHALILAPRSIVEMMRFLFSSIFFKGILSSNSLPDFVGHIKSDSIMIESPKEISFTVDGEAYLNNTIELQVKPRCLKVYPGRFLSLDKETPVAKERFKVASLPVGEACTSLLKNSLPLINHASTEEFKDLFTVLRENAKASESFLVFMVLATMLATFGLFADSSPAVIGAMIVAPLMSPIISLSMGILRQHEQLISESIKTLAIGICLSISCAVLITIFTPLKTLNTEISNRLSPTLLDLGVAVASGMVGAYAHARPGLSLSLAGVAIAVALVPPLSVTGIGIGWLDFHVFSRAFLMFLTNLAGIVLAGALTFLALGYSPFLRAKRGVVQAFIITCLISIPLGLSFNNMVFEHRIIKQFQGQEYEGLLIEHVSVRRQNPLHVSLRLLSSDTITIKRVDSFKKYMQETLQMPIKLEVTIAITR